MDPAIKAAVFKVVENYTIVEHREFPRIEMTYNVAHEKKGMKFKNLRKDLQKALCFKNRNVTATTTRPSTSIR